MFVEFVIYRAHGSSAYEMVSKVAADPLASLPEVAVTVAVSSTLEHFAPNSAPGTLAGDAAAVAARQRLAKELATDTKPSAHRPSDDILRNFIGDLITTAKAAGCSLDLPGHGRGRESTPLFEFVGTALSMAAERGLVVLENRHDLSSASRGKAQRDFNHYRAMKDRALVAQIERAMVGT